MIDWYPWIVLAHVMGAFGFILAHGVSAFVAFRLRAARGPEQVATLMELSSASFGVLYPSLLLLLVAGIAAGFVRSLWGELWIWLSIGLFFAITVAMYLVGTRFYIEVRHAVGKAVPQDSKGAPPPTPLSADELVALLDSPRPYLLAAIGGGGLALIILLMVIKPG
jgi:Predicted integral membrane protein (DUF2269).